MKQQDIREMEGYREMYLKTIPVETRLEGLEPERVLANYAPEERLLGLDRDQQALALPVEVLRALSEEYILSPCSHARNAPFYGRGASCAARAQRPRRPVARSHSSTSASPPPARV